MHMHDSMQCMISSKASSYHRIAQFYSLTVLLSDLRHYYGIDWIARWIQVPVHWINLKLPSGLSISSVNLLAGMLTRFERFPFVCCFIDFVVYMFLMIVTKLASFMQMLWMFAFFTPVMGVHCTRTQTLIILDPSSWFSAQIPTGSLSMGHTI